MSVLLVRDFSGGSSNLVWKLVLLNNTGLFYMLSHVWGFKVSAGTHPSNFLLFFSPPKIKFFKGCLISLIVNGDGVVRRMKTV